MEDMYNFLDYISDRLDADWEITHNMVYIVKKSYDENLNIIENLIYMQFNISNNILYNFHSDFFRGKILPTNYEDFLLDVLLLIKKYIVYDKLNKQFHK